MKSIFQSALVAASFLTLFTSVLASADTEVPMTLEGQFRVDESGAAAYSIPIKMLPGRAGC
ncbi:hypothetical protein [Vibrio sp.]|uniref:hypothetical protein n=1 Tax=Vibrio sp. TaxID=678 RepID=UPI003D09F7F3